MPIDNMIATSAVTLSRDMMVDVFTTLRHSRGSAQ